MGVSRTALSVVGVVLVVATTLRAQENGAVSTWPDYRGPTWNGHADGANVPLEWSEKENVRWKTAVRGAGWSTPVVWGQQIWLTSAIEDGQKLYAIAVDLESGEVEHEMLVFEVEEPEHKNKLNSYASPSPVIEAGRVYVHFGTYGTACLDTATAEIIWRRRDIKCDHMEGPGSSPVLYEDLLIFNVDGSDVQFVIALDKKTGETRWKTGRSVGLERFPPNERKAFSTPILVEVDGAQQLVSSGSEGVAAYDPATGKELWVVRHSGFSMSARPLTDGRFVYINTGFHGSSGTRILAVRTSGEGDMTGTNIAWSYRRGVPTMGSALLADGRIYMVSDGGVASCLLAESGKRLWRQRIGGQYSASPVLAGGRIYFFDREGRSVVLAAAESYRKLAENRLDGGFMASPAVAGDDLVLRTKSHLYRISTN